MGISNTYIGNIYQIASSIQSALNTSPWILAGSYTVAAAARADMTVSGLDLETDKTYYFLSRFLTATTEKCGLIVSGDTTTTHYNTSKNGAAAANVFELSTNGVTAHDYFIEGFMYKRAGVKATAYITQQYDGVGATTIYHDAWETTGTTNVTSLALYGAAAGNHFDVGSWLKVYKLVV